MKDLASQGIRPYGEEREFFITARSFAAPFFSDESTGYVKAESAEAALTKFAAGYSHPFGLYAAEAWESADHYQKSKVPLARWLSNHDSVSPRWIGSKRRLWWGLVQTGWPAEKMGLYATMPLTVEDARKVAVAAGVPLAALLLPDPTRWQMFKAHLRSVTRGR